MRALGKTGLRRLAKANRETHPPRVELAFLLQSVDDPVNVGAVFRIADACGAREIVLAGDTPAPPHPGIGMTSRGADRRVPWRHVRAIEDAAAALRAGGWGLVAVELADGAVAHVDYPYPPRTCLVLGSEGRGVWPKTLRLCDGAVYIPMYGKHPSLNVHVAAAVVAFAAVVGGRPQVDARQPSAQSPMPTGSPN